MTARLLLGFTLALLGGSGQASDYATRVLAHNGTGGMVGYNEDPSLALGPPSTSARPEAPDNSSLFSFGWGGSITLGFDRPIRNDPRHPGGYDFIVFGNAFYLPGDVNYAMAEPGWVEVGVDPTGKGEYGDGSGIRWYWLKPVPAPETTAGYPIPAPAGETTVYRGYADVTPTDGQGDPLVPDDPETPGITPGTAGGDPFDLAWAVDASGAPANLAEAHFVRIHCAVDAYRPPLGQISTEVDAVSLVRPRVMGDVDMDGSVTLADAVLAARALAGGAVLTSEQALRADVADPAGGPDAADAAAILRLAAGAGP